MTKKVDLRFKDKITEIEEGYEGEWITVYSASEDKTEFYYSAIIQDSLVDQSLKDSSWDMHIGNGTPGIVYTWNEGEQIASYYRFSKEGVEPLVIQRNFHGIQEDYWDISEEFRLYHNLYENKKNNKYYYIDENGELIEAVIIENDKIRIKSKYLKEFLSVKKMQLAIFFDFNRYSNESLEDLGLKEYRDSRHEVDFCYSIGAQKWRYGDDRKSFSWLMGKKMIRGLEDFKPDIFGLDNKSYEDFIIDVDGNGNPILYTCDEEKLANYFGKNEGSPHYLTPVYFRKEVLAKYYANPEKYSIEDGAIRCAGLWILRLDNNNPDYVMVFLGDLGTLTNKEQLYWKSFNVAQKGKISHTAWKRGFEAQFADPEKSDLYFKQKFTSFQKKWNKKFGWNLFRDLPEEDEYHFKTLRIPLTNDQKEFDEQILSLTKIMIDSLNEKELRKGIVLENNMKGIDKLQAFLKSKDHDIPELIKYLRNLQDIRSRGVAHLKGKKYAKLKAELKIEDKELSEVFDDILIDAIRTLNTLEKYFL